jgi:ATP-dependent RNA circularization protein (DNA/RNA ligase family)
METRMKVIMKGLNLKWLAIQGEIIGPGIQKNPYQMKDVDFLVFNIITPEGRLGNKEMVELCDLYCLTTVPMISYDYILPDTVEGMLQYATDKSMINSNVLREGVVVHSQDGKRSFKAVSPEYLIKHGK